MSGSTDELLNDIHSEIYEFLDEKRIYWNYELFMAKSDTNPPREIALESRRDAHTLAFWLTTGRKVGFIIRESKILKSLTSTANLNPEIYGNDTSSDSATSNQLNGEAIALGRECSPIRVQGSRKQLYSRNSISNQK